MAAKEETEGGSHHTAPTQSLIQSEAHLQRQTVGLKNDHPLQSQLLRRSRKRSVLSFPKNEDASHLQTVIPASKWIKVISPISQIEHKSADKAEVL